MRTPSDRLMFQVREAFMNFGYEAPTMAVIADACDVSRRTLYNYFTSKEQAYRAVLEWLHEAEIKASLNAWNRVLAESGNVLDALVATMYARYGDTRSRLAQSPHALELNFVTFRYFRDTQIASAVDFQDKLAAAFIEARRAGLLDLKKTITPTGFARLACDAARGINQSIPPFSMDELPAQYRRMFDVMLHGCLMPKPTAAAETLGSAR